MGLYCYRQASIKRISGNGIHSSAYLSMVIIKDAAPRRKELALTLAPLVQMYAKPMSSPKAILDLVARLAAVMEEWGYSPKELQSLDRRAFIDLVRSWQAEAPAQDTALIKAVI